jgi:murein DD-endopeptidase MepM/ murein hydrolase activator NlpD
VQKQNSHIVIEAQAGKETEPFLMPFLQRLLLRWPSLIIFLFGLSCVAAFAFVPTNDVPTKIPTTTLTLALDLPPKPPLLDDVLADEPTFYWVEERIQRGDVIGNVLSRAGLNDPEVRKFIVSDPAARPLYRLRPGRPLRLALDGQGKLHELRLLLSPEEMFMIMREGDTFKTQTIIPEREIRREQRFGEIRSSLFGAADAAGIPDAVTIGMANILGGEIDFYHDLRQGDRFSVVYEMTYVEGELVNSGRILAAEFINRGNEYSAYLWQSPNSEQSGSYYNAKGESSKKAFLRAPLEFSRISSNFSPARLHPLFKSKRAHTGTDFAAPTGTPVRAGGDGVVEFIGKKGGYGNLVILRHAGEITTYYGHLSRFASTTKKGKRVKQGDVIAYVGSSGWATGPHLHYEFRVANKPRDPLKAVLPPSPPISDEYKELFLRQVMVMQEYMQLARDMSGITTIARASFD